MFSVLAVFSFNRVVRLPNSMLVSAIPMVAIAAVVVFATHDAPAGALAVGALGAVNFATLRGGGWGWIALNAGQIGFPSLAAGAACTRRCLDSFPEDLPGALGVVVPIAVVYIVVAWSMILSRTRSS